MKTRPSSAAGKGARTNGGSPPSDALERAVPSPSAGQTGLQSPPAAQVILNPRPWVSALTLVRWICVIGFTLVAIVSLSTYGSHVYRETSLHEPYVLALAIAAGLTALAAWWRFASDKSNQNLILFATFAALAAAYGLQIAQGAGIKDADHLGAGAVARLVFGVGIVAAVAGIQSPVLIRLPTPVIAGLVALLAISLGLAVHSDVVAGWYEDAPRTFLRRMDAFSVSVNLFALLWVARAWWKTRRPFLIYLIGAISALTLGSALFIASSPWEGRWWVAHLGVFVSAVVLGDGIVAEKARRGKLSEVMDLGGLSRLAEGTVDAMRDGLALHDADGTLVGWNPAAEQITGWPREMAAIRLSANLPEGTVELARDKWVDVRHFTVRQNGYSYQATLFTDVTSRRHAEEALRESEERYRSLVEVSPDAVILTDLEGKVTLCNRRAAALHGYENGEELIGSNFFDLVAPDDRESAMANAVRTVRLGGVRDVEYRMVRQDGTFFSAELSAAIIRDQAGRPQTITSVIRDVTERKRTDEALQRSEEHFRSLTENLSDVILILDASGTILYESPSVERVLGHRPEERVGHKVFDYVHPEDLSQITDAFRLAIKTSGTLHTAELRVKHADGSWRDLDCIGRIKTGDDGRPVAIVTARDVTERKSSAQALLASEERYRGLVQASPDAVAMSDLRGRILLCNQQAAMLHGYRNVDDVLGLNSFDLIAAEDRGVAAASARRMVDSGAVTHMEYDLLRRDGSRFPAEVSTSRVLDTEGRPIGMTTVWRDISERRRAEDELRQTNSLVELLRSVAVAANEATSLRSVLEFALRRVCDHVGWPAGHAYVPADDAEGGLVSSRIWSLDASSRTRPFREASERMRFPEGEGLAGSVLASGAPAWVPDLRDTDFERAEHAQKAGIRAAFAFPVLAGNEVVAVLEFFSEEFEEPDGALLEVMAGIGSTLGRVVERKRARDEIDRVFTLSQDMLMIAGFDGNMKRVNETFSHALAYAEGELVGVRYLELVHPEDLTATYSELKRLAEGASIKGFELRMLCKDGSYIWTQWNATPFAAEKAIYAQGRDITERKRSEIAIQTATDEIRDLYNAAPCGYHSLDKRGYFVRINDTELEWLGYKRNEVIGNKKLGDVLTPASRVSFSRAQVAFRKRGWMRALEVEMVRKDGTTFPALLSSSAVRDAQGAYVMSRSTVFDITERKRAEEELRESELRARTIVNTAYDAFVAIDSTGTITDWNPQAESTFGWTRKEAIGRKLAETIVPRRFRRAHAQGLDRYLRTGKGPVLNKRIELVAMHKEGHEFPIETTISPVQMGDEYAFNAFIHDITERRQAETTRARLAAIVESSDDAIIGTTLDGTITSWNKGAVRLYGYTTSEAVGQSISMLVPPDRQDEAPAILEREMAGERVDHFETVRLRKDGTNVEVSLTISPIIDADGVITGASTIARDVTARKRAEALARQTEELARSNADLEQFAYVASHDLQEPLRMVTGYCDLLQRRYHGKLDADADDFITFAVDGAKRMQELVRGLLAYSRVGPHGRTLEPVDASNVYERAVANLALAIEESGATVTTGPLPTVIADATQLEHVFQNLIGNAIKFTEDEPPRVEVAATREGEMWQFCVKDNGIGIDPRYEEKVFTIFQRLHGRGKYPGTGLGLAICKKIIERHGGRIWFESEQDRGTTFYFTIPAERR